MNFCKDCKHFEQPFMHSTEGDINHGPPICNQFPDPVMGKGQYCEQMRLPAQRCGPDGHRFERRDD
jgi:hypothetical protein